MVEDRARSSAQSSRRGEYISRINRVIDYIESNIDGDLSLEAIARVALFSPYHFHRVFGAMVGETLNGFIQRIRLEKAAVQLIVNPKESITDIALGCGFTGSATFARAFKEAYGLSASQWRAGGYKAYCRSLERDSKNRKAQRKNRKDLSPLSRYLDGAVDSPIHIENDYERGRDTMAKTNVQALQVEVQHVPEFHVAYVRHIGPYKGDSELFARLFQKLMTWAGPRGLLRFPETRILAIYHDNPDITDEDKLRVSACISVPEDTPVEGEVGKMAIPEGKYAIARFELDMDDYQGAWDYLFGVWLPDSGYQPDEGPCYELYHDSAEDQPGKKHLVDIYLPVKPL